MRHSFGSLLFFVCSFVLLASAQSEWAIPLQEASHDLLARGWESSTSSSESPSGFTTELYSAPFVGWSSPLDTDTSTSTSSSNSEFIGRIFVVIGVFTAVIFIIGLITICVLAYARTNGWSLRKRSLQLISQDDGEGVFDDDL